MHDVVRGVASRTALVGSTLSALLVGSLLLAGSASAVGEDPVLDAFTELQGKVTTYGGAIVLLVVAVTVLFFGIKFFKRGSRSV